MVDDKIIQEWLIKADEDFAFARINLEERKPFFAQTNLSKSVVIGVIGGLL